MRTFSTRQAAKELGLSHVALVHYIAAKKIPAPKMVTVGNFRLHVWTEAEVEHVRKLLPKIKNGRKTRYQKQKKQTKPNKK